MAKEKKGSGVERIDKSEYKDAVVREKKKLFT